MAMNFGSEDGDAEDALLAALVEVHRRKQRGDRVVADGGDARARIVAHFARRGQRLRGERLVTAELIDRLFSASEAMPPRRNQQEVRIAGRAGGTAAGRLRVSNRSSTPARFELVVGDPVEGDRSPIVRLNPAHGDVEPGASEIVRVEAALDG